MPSLLIVHFQVYTTVILQFVAEILIVSFFMSTLVHVVTKQKEMFVLNNNHIIVKEW
jgi:hypothetical protein